MPSTNQLPRIPPKRSMYLLESDNPETLKRRLAVCATRLSLTDRLQYALALRDIADNESRAEAVRENESSEAA